MSEPAPRSLVTGACGVLGSHVCEVLVKAGHEVLAIDRAAACVRDDPQRGRFPSVARGLGVELVGADLVRDPLAPLLRGVDYVFHFFELDAPTASAADLRRENEAATEALLGVALEEGVRRFVHKSAAGARDRYLESKALAERRVMACATERGLEATILRPAGLYGPRHRGLARLARRRLLAAPRNLRERRPFVHVRDVARAALHLAAKAQARGRIYTVVDDSKLSPRDTLRLVARLMGRAYVDLPSLPLRTLRGRLGAVLGLDGPTGGADNTPLKDLGFRFEYPEASRGIRDTLIWYKQEGWLA